MSHHSFVSRFATLTVPVARDVFRLIKTPLGMAWLGMCVAATVFIIAVVFMILAAPTVQAAVREDFDTILFVYVIAMATFTACLAVGTTGTLIRRYRSLSAARRSLRPSPFR